MRMRYAWLVVPLALVGCATGRPVGSVGRAQAVRYRPLTPGAPPRLIPEQPGPVPPAMPLPPLTGSRDTVLARARALVGKQRLVLDGRTFPATCNGLVEAAYAPTGLRLAAVVQPGDNAVTALYRLALAQGRVYREGRPAPGDLAFFRDTYDLNRDGRTNDGLTHVGIVEEVDAEGTVTVIHHVERGVVRYRMTPEHPTVRKDARTGRVLNQALRAGKEGRAVALTGELFVTYASLLPAASAVASR
jgi:peptidoglycan DL-endopeptidase CwlO